MIFVGGIASIAALLLWSCILTESDHMIGGKVPRTLRSAAVDQSLRLSVWMSPGAVSLTLSAAAFAVAPAAAKDAISAWYNPRNERIYDTRRRTYIPGQYPLSNSSRQELVDSKVTCIGEIHSNPCHHHVELDVIKALVESVPAGTEVAIGMECFYRQHQASLDRFVFSHGDMGTLRNESNWSSTWGFDLNYYAKIFNYAHRHRVRIIGLNLPYAVARYVSAFGLDGLPQSIQALLPAVDLANAKHRQMFMEAITGSTVHSDENLERMYQTQTLWEEYMAQSVSNYLRESPTSRMIVIAGLGHIKGRVGIPDRIARYTGINPFVIVPYQTEWNDETGLPDILVPPSQSDCDWVWFTEKEIPT
jgi:uncharacterized iron-regulated protein